MKGLIVKCGEKVYKVAIPDNGVNVMVNITHYDGASWCVGGVKMPEETHISWNSGMLEVGDEIEIEFAELDESDEITPPMNEVSHEAILEKAWALDDEKSILWDRQLDIYFRLKKILEEEHLIEKE